jgi:hypothetical protein
VLVENMLPDTTPETDDELRELIRNKAAKKLYKYKKNRARVNLWISIGIASVLGTLFCFLMPWHAFENEFVDNAFTISGWVSLGILIAAFIRVSTAYYFTSPGAMRALNFDDV